MTRRPYTCTTNLTGLPRYFVEVGARSFSTSTSPSPAPRLPSLQPSHFIPGRRVVPSGRNQLAGARRCSAYLRPIQPINNSSSLIRTPPCPPSTNSPRQRARNPPLDFLIPQLPTKKYWQRSLLASMHRQILISHIHPRKTTATATRWLALAVLSVAKRPSSRTAPRNRFDLRETPLLMTRLPRPKSRFLPLPARAVLLPNGAS